MYLDFALESRLVFIGEEWTETYKRYVEGNTAGKNSNMTQEKWQVSSYAGKQDTSAHKTDEVSYSAVSKWIRVTT